MPAAPPILGSTGSTTIVLAALLVALGIAMIVAAAWLVRATRTDVPALAPLEVMGARRFARRDTAARAAALAGVRPEGALGPAPMVEIDESPADVGAAPEPVVEPATVTGGEVVTEPTAADEPVAVEEPDPEPEVETVDDGEMATEPTEVEPPAEDEASGGAAEPAADTEAAETAPRAH